MGPGLRRGDRWSDLMTPRDSRRQPGINLLWDRPGGVLEVDLPKRADEAVALWRQQVRRLLDAPPKRRLRWENIAHAANGLKFARLLFFFGGATYAAEQTKDGARGLSVKQG